MEKIEKVLVQGIVGVWGEGEGVSGINVITGRLVEVCEEKKIVPETLF